MHINNEKTVQLSKHYPKNHGQTNNYYYLQYAHLGFHLKTTQQQTTK